MGGRIDVKKTCFGSFAVYFQIMVKQGYDGYSVAEYFDELRRKMFYLPTGVSKLLIFC